MKRIFYFDNLKGLLILCVVLEHTLTICSNYYGFNYSLFKIISFFIIPLFIFTTGKFAKRSRKTPFKRALKMLKIYIIAQILVTIYYGYVLQIISPSKSLLTPRFTLWYLLSCTFLYLSEYIIKNYKFRNVFIISLLIALGSGFISQVTDSLSLTRTIATMPFFIVGYYSEDINILEFASKYKRIIFILISLITIWFIFHQNFFLFKDTYLKYNYFTYRNPMECFLKRTLLYVFFFIFSLFILNIIPKKKIFLANLGNKTLSIYLVHGTLLKTMEHFCLFIDNPIIGTISTYFISILISVLLDYVTKIIKNLRFMYFNKEKMKLTNQKFQPIQKESKYI